jgi:hypothetical protein
MGVKLMDLRGAEKLQAIAPVVSQETAEVETEEAPAPKENGTRPKEKGQKGRAK